MKRIDAEYLKEKASKYLLQTRKKPKRATTTIEVILNAKIYYRR